jgi:hypothetical protein
MALPFEAPATRDARALSILAKTIYRELRTSGFQTRDVIALAGELLGHVTSEVTGGGYDTESDPPAQGPASGVERVRRRA